MGLIEVAFAKRAIPEPWDKISERIDKFNPTECRNFFRHSVICL